MTARSRYASCTSWTISVPARRWSASASWTSREPGTLARRHHDRLRSAGRGTAGDPGGRRILQPGVRPDAETGAAPGAGLTPGCRMRRPRSEEHTSELQSLAYLVCRLLLEKKKKES